MKNRPFTSTHRARFHEADPAGILFFGEAYRLAHGAFEDFVTQALGFSWKDWFDGQEWGVPLRKTECEHLSAILPGYDVVVNVTIEALGESSMTLLYHLTQRRPAGANPFNPAEPSSLEESSAPVLCAQVRMVHAFASHMTRKKAPIPSEVRRRLETYQRECLSAP